MIRGIFSNSNNLSKITSFGARFIGADYDKNYLKNKDHNGICSDTFILKQLNNSDPDAEFIDVLDVGAGQGRNTIPIAQQGHNVTAFEISSIGRSDIQNKALEKGVLRKVKVINQNLLDKFKIAKKFDFAFMSHVSQHFDPKEFETVLKNIADLLKDGKMLIFDALIRKEGVTAGDIFEKYACNSRELEDDGAANFSLDEIKSVAKKSGFKIVKQSDFAEKGGRPLYEFSRNWGSDAFAKSKPNMILPVKLKWFVLQKL